MPNVIVTAQVQDPAKWEAGFRMHGELFRKYTCSLRFDPMRECMTAAKKEY